MDLAGPQKNCAKTSRLPSDTGTRAKNVSRDRWHSSAHVAIRVSKVLLSGATLAVGIARARQLSRRSMRMPEEKNSAEPRETPKPASSKRLSLTRIRRWRRRNLYLLLGGVVAVLALGIILWHYFSGFESTDDAQVDAH